MPEALDASWNEWNKVGSFLEGLGDGKQVHGPVIQTGCVCRAMRCNVGRSFLGPIRQSPVALALLDLESGVGLHNPACNCVAGQVVNSAV